jgi:hypothetical protein
MPPHPGVSPIEVKVADVHRLFNSMDPSPFRERDLDQEAEEFIVSWARESPKDASIRLVVHVAKPSPDVPDPTALVTESVRNYFSYRAEITRRELRQIFREGRFSLAIGLLFLAVCNVGAAALFAPGPGTWHGIAREGLSIIGWVAMWHPLDVLLYRWWPVLQTVRLHERLAVAEVAVIEAAG